MCNLYRINRSTAEIAGLFRVRETPGANFASEVYPGYPGVVVAGDALRVMNWGFPRVLTGKDGSKLKPRPVTAWAEPQGEKGRMTRTWYSLPGEDIFAIGGMWRPSEEWGDVYTMVMVPASVEMTDVHDRMPVILRREDWAT